MNKGNQLPLVFDNDNVSEANSKTHLGVVFDKHLSFDEHLKIITSKVNKTIGLLRKLCKGLQRSHELTIYKKFLRDLISITAALYMTKITVEVFIRNLN